MAGKKLVCAGLHIYTKNNNPDETENFPATDIRRRYTCRQESTLSKDRVDTVADPVRIVTGPTVCPGDVTTDKRGGSIVIFVSGGACIYDKLRIFAV